MNLQESIEKLRSERPVARGEVIQAVLVVLAHARQRLEGGNIQEARKLASNAERGLQALQSQVLLPLLDKARAGGMLRDISEAADEANRALDKVFSALMRAPRPTKIEVIEAMTSESALAWLTRVVLGVDSGQQGSPREREGAQ